MAMATYELTSAWQQVFDGTSQANCVLQANDPCEIAIATTTPVGADLDKSIKLREKPEGSGYEFASSGLTGQKIYARETFDASVIMTVASW
jgi:hypothetical protein